MIFNNNNKGVLGYFSEICYFTTIYDEKMYYFNTKYQS